MPRISVIVPVYNTAMFLPDCIDSILAQTFDDFECILVNDGSSDESPSICDAYAEKNAKIRVIHQNNAGLSAARNAGMEMAHGDWITFIDSDDIIYENYLHLLYETAIKYNAEISCCSYRTIHAGERERERESLTYKSLECPRDTFSLISYRYVKIPEPDPDVFTPVDPPVHYPFYYPFSFPSLRFSHKLLIVIEIQKNSEKISFFRDLLAFFIRTELPPAMMTPAWSAGVFFIYGTVPRSSAAHVLPRIRSPPLASPLQEDAESPLGVLRR